jgi:hypothetical protein
MPSLKVRFIGSKPGQTAVAIRSAWLRRFGAESIIALMEQLLLVHTLQLLKFILQSSL